MPSSRGSAEVEAALILPLVILIIVGMVKLSVTLCSKVELGSLAGSEAASSIAEGGTIPAESILRGRWYFK